MKIVSFNINGIRAHKHQLEFIMKVIQPDIIGLQETKIHDKLFPTEFAKQYNYYSYFYGQSRYNGVAILCKKKPISIVCGFDSNFLSFQKRIITANFLTNYGMMSIINGYFPQGDSILNTEKFLIKKRFFQNLQNQIESKYDSQSLLVVMGDMNISPTDLDIGIGEVNKKKWLFDGKCSFLPEERRWMYKFFSWGLVDIFRKFFPNQGDYYSWFDYRYNGFLKNRGLRIDLILVSIPMMKHVKSVGINYSIRSMYRPSDHAPVWLETFLN